MPAEAKGTSQKSAKAFVRYYIDVLNFATATGDTGTALRLSSPNCDSCSGMLDKIQDVYSQGGYFRGEGWTVTDIKYQPLQSDVKPILTIGIQLADQDMLEHADGKVKHFEGGPNRLTLHLASKRSRWLVTQLDRLS